MHRFVFASESCLPVVTLGEMELALFGPRSADLTTAGGVASPYDKSWVNARSTPNNGYAQQLQWDAIRPADVPPALIWKADQWLVLARAHAAAVVGLPRRHLGGRPLWPALRRVRASDEMYFPTALAILGALRRPPGGGEVDDARQGEKCAGSDVRRRRLTYCDWSVGAKSPASFRSAAEWRRVAATARKEGCLLARKFAGRAGPAVPRRGGERGAGGTGPADDAGHGWLSVEEWRSAVGKGGGVSDAGPR